MQSNPPSEAAQKGAAQKPPVPPRPTDYVPLSVAKPAAEVGPAPAPAAVPPAPPPSISATFSSDWSGVKQRNMLIRVRERYRCLA